MFLQYRSFDYFKPKTLYLVNNGFRIILAEAELYRNSWWFTYPGMHIKATTTQSIALSEMANIEVSYKPFPTITGKIMGHTGIINTPYLYVFWYYGMNIKLPMPCALPDIYDLIF
jgi:hypothetical protein